MISQLWSGNYLSQCWPGSLLACGVIRPQWVNFPCWWCQDICKHICLATWCSSWACWRRLIMLYQHGRAVFWHIIDTQAKATFLCSSEIILGTLRWRHNGRDSVSNHHPHDCLLNRVFRRKPKKTSKLRVIGLCAGNSSGTGEFPTQMASNAENVSIWWRHHGT